MNRLSPGLFLDAVNSYQRTAAIKAAIELDLFTAIGQGRETSQELALSCGASERGMRILSDYLVVMGFLRKKRGRYGLTVDSAMLLDRRSPAYYLRSWRSVTRKVQSLNACRENSPWDYESFRKRRARFTRRLVFNLIPLSHMLDLV